MNSVIVISLGIFLYPNLYKSIIKIVISLKISRHADNICSPYIFEISLDEHNASSFSLRRRNKSKLIKSISLSSTEVLLSESTLLDNASNVNCSGIKSLGAALAHVSTSLSASLASNFNFER